MNPGVGDYNIANVHLNAVEYKDQIVFMHQVEEGPAAKSYGIQVAALAGVPKTVLSCAKKYLTHLEQNSQNQAQLDLFSLDETIEEAAPQHSAAEEGVLQQLRQINPDNLSAKQALDLLYELSSVIDG